MSKTTGTAREAERKRRAPLVTPTDLTREATKEVTGAMNAILADVFALYIKAKNFHWHFERTTLS